jgi:hypothetical protein
MKTVCAKNYRNLTSPKWRCVYGRLVMNRANFSDGILRFGNRAVSALVVIVAATGCQAMAAGPGFQADEHGPHITLRRGVTGSSLSMRPPYFSGRDFSLTLRKQTLFGWVSPAGAGGGAMRVQVDPDSATGFGPHGSIGMDIFTDEAATVADGLWDGQRVHMSFALDGVNGTVADVRETRPRGARLGEHGATDSCQYVLDRVTAEGALEGFSICAGLPQRTRLEVPQVATTLLSRAELVTVLVTMLSAPPLAQIEAGRSLDEFEAVP